VKTDDLQALSLKHFGVAYKFGTSAGCSDGVRH